MTRYFFHLHECGTVLLGDEGADLPDMDAAIARGVVVAREIMAEEVRHGRLCLACFFEIEDEAKTETARVYFRDAIVVTGF